MDEIVRPFAKSDATSDLSAEWLETDGLGGFASGTVSGVRSRRYHALLLVATRPPVGRLVLVNGFDAWLETTQGTVPITGQHYAPGVIAPENRAPIEDFTIQPWPTWRFSLRDGGILQQELFIPHGQPTVIIRWSIVGDAQGLKLHLRPLFSGRDYHSLHHENPAFTFEPSRQKDCLTWTPYAGIPAINLISNGEYDHHPLWYRNFLYASERERGLDYLEDLASPGIVHWDLSQADAVLVLTASDEYSHKAICRDAVCDFVDRIADDERRRRERNLHSRSADAYIVARAGGKTVIAGYPWFTDWGRDTFIAMRGLCLSTGRLDVATEILLAWAKTVSQGMLPNRFPDGGAEPEFNSVDASLWFVIVVHELLEALDRCGQSLPNEQREKLTNAVNAILAGYSAGTRHGIRMDLDGLLAAGEPGTQLTWMDAKVGDWVVTPRIGKPVEVQALWLNALWIGSQISQQWKSAYASGRASFESRFWHSEGEHLYDVVDVNHQSGITDATFRPNQMFAIGGLPLQLIDGDRARCIVDAVEARLLTPVGLRSLDSADPAYIGRYQGDVERRDAAYHQGTIWPWLMGPFVEAWLRVRGGTDEARMAARHRFLPGLTAHLDQAGLGHISEIADGDPPHLPRGCPFQAWSLGEFLRIQNTVLNPQDKDQ